MATYYEGDGIWSDGHGSIMVNLNHDDVTPQQIKKTSCQFKPAVKDYKYCPYCGHILSSSLC